MAYIQEKLKGKKAVSFKFKACVGRDADGKQIFKCTTWYPPAELTPAKARKEAQKVAVLWEDEARQAYLKERESKPVAGCSPLPFLYLRWLRNAYRKPDGKPLAEKSIKHHYNILGLIFAYAEKQDITQKNPMKKADPPKVTKREVGALTEDEAVWFFNALLACDFEFRCVL